MADSEKDVPENQGIKGVWNHTLGRKDEKGRSVSSIALGSGLSHVFADGDGEAFTMLLTLSAFAVGIGTLGVEVGEYFLWSAQDDAAISAPLASAETPNGYSAIVGGGQNGTIHILVRTNDTWRVYEKSSGAEARFVDDPIAALQIARTVNGALAVAQQQSASPSGHLDNLPRDVSFTDVSRPYAVKDDADQYAVRYFDNQQLIANTGEAIPARYERLQSIWAQAESDIRGGKYGFTAAEFSAMEEPDRFFVDGGLTTAKYIGGGIGALWLLIAFGIGTAEAVQRTSPSHRTSNSGRSPRSKR